MKFSKRITDMQASPIRKLVPYANEAKAKGKKVYHLNIGQPDIETPAGFFDAVRNFKEDVLAYSTSAGSNEMLDAIRKYYEGYGIEYEREHVIVTNGGSEALMFAMIAVCDPGDEILVPEPFYTNYNGFGQAVNVTLKPITTRAENGFHLPPEEEIEKTITSATKAVLMSNPGNPTGVVYTDAEIAMLAKLAKKHDLFIIADEVYREFVYDGLKYTSFGTLKEIEDRVILVDSVSKRFSACGARIGCIVSKNRELMGQVMKLAQGRLCVPTLEQVGAAELYKTPMSYLKEVNEEYTRRRNILYKALKEMPGVVCEEPKGAFYVVVKLPVDNAEKFVIWMLRDFDVDGETVMMAPAEGFYATPGLGRDEVRLAYVLKEKDLARAMDILKAGLEAYPGRVDAISVSA